MLLMCIVLTPTVIYNMYKSTTSQGVNNIDSICIRYLINIIIINYFMNYISLTYFLLIHNLKMYLFHIANA